MFTLDNFVTFAKTKPSAKRNQIQKLRKKARYEIARSYFRMHITFTVLKTRGGGGGALCTMLLH